MIVVEALALAALLVWLVILMKPWQSPVQPQVTVEAGTASVDVKLFQVDPEKPLTPATDLTLLDLTKVGTYEIVFLYRDRPYNSTLFVVDTTPPAVKTAPQQIYNDETLPPEVFVTEISDISQVTVTFVQQPVFTQVGEQTVSVLVTDASGNAVTVTEKLTVIADTTPPQFSELPDITVQVNGSVSYKKDVNVSDDRDGALTFEVDTSGVDLQKAGSYIAVYSARDKSGNETKAERKITVQEQPVINRELVDQLAKETIAKILTDGMTPQQKAKAVFTWVRKNMTYVSSPETDIPNAAYVAFVKKRGDCTNYYAVTSVLLDNCGIENRKIERSGGKTDHVWLLVNVGSGWYHMDTSPQSLKDPFVCFMKTDQEVWDYAKKRKDGRTDYYSFDTTAYPERATEKYDG
ncbi:MAG: transglutaminase domain-containing protein [Oscillospiraceae bacterium]|nr:transglutaminase domain-containing protein [Oscillospiraceae bacterium]